MMEQIVLYQFSKDELVDIIRTELKNISSNSENNLSEEFTELLTRSEVVELLKISLPTLSEWTKKGWLNSYRIGNSIRYKRSEIINSLKQINHLKFKRK